jgi:hypothetical protein
MRHALAYEIAIDDMGLRRRLPVWRPTFDLSLPAISAPRQSFDKSGVFRRIPERLTKSVHCGTDAVFVFNNGVIRPKPFSQILSGY